MAARHTRRERVSRRHGWRALSDPRSLDSGSPCRNDEINLKSDKVELGNATAIRADERFTVRKPDMLGKTSRLVLPDLRMLAKCAQNAQEQAFWAKNKPDIANHWAYLLS